MGGVGGMDGWGEWVGGWAYLLFVPKQEKAEPKTITLHVLHCGFCRRKRKVGGWVGGC